MKHILQDYWLVCQWGLGVFRGGGPAVQEHTGGERLFSLRLNNDPGLMGLRKNGRLCSALGYGKLIGSAMAQRWGRGGRW